MIVPCDERDKLTGDGCCLEDGPIAVARTPRSVPSAKRQTHQFGHGRSRELRWCVRAMASSASPRPTPRADRGDGTFTGLWPPMVIQRSRGEHHLHPPERGRRAGRRIRPPPPEVGQAGALLARARRVRDMVRRGGHGAVLRHVPDDPDLHRSAPSSGIDGHDGHLPSSIFETADKVLRRAPRAALARAVPSTRRIPRSRDASAALASR